MCTRAKAGEKYSGLFSDFPLPSALAFVIMIGRGETKHYEKGIVMKSASEVLTGKKGPAYRLNTLFPEAEYRYLYAILCEHEPVSETGKDTLARILPGMGKKIDEINERSR